MKNTNGLPIKQSRHRECGVAAVEFAFILPVMLLIFAGIAEFGRAFWYYDALAKATRDGVRVMTIYPKSAIQSAGIGMAKDIVVDAANSAGVNPSLNGANVVITCLDASFTPLSCQDGVAPDNIEVAINNYSINIGKSVPFFSYEVPLAPYTIMRYML